MDCWRISSRLVSPRWFSPSARLRAGVRGTRSPPDGEGGEGPPPATENNINAMPRDRVQDGGRLTWPINSMPVTYNYHHIDGTEADHTYSKLALMPRIYLTDAGSDADLES